MNQMRYFSLKLNDGHFMPALGFGTSAPHKVPKERVEEAVQRAIEVGYRHIDSAYVYNNEEEVGRAIQKKIADGTVRRQDVFYTSKPCMNPGLHPQLWPTFYHPEMVREALETSLRKAQLSYVDLYLMHFPGALKPGEDPIPMNACGQLQLDTVDICATWEVLEQCKMEGLARSIGVSNFNRRQLEMILNKPGLKYAPVCNQVECHPYLNQNELLDFCRTKDIVLVAYAALGSDPEKEWVTKNNPLLLEDPVLKTIAERHQRSPGQVALRFQLQRGLAVLAKSFTEKHIQENIQVFDFQLSSEDMEAMLGLNRNLHYFKELE